MRSAPKKWIYHYAGRSAFREALLPIVVVGLCFLLSSPGAADAKSPTTLSGVTSQGMPGNIRVSGSGRMINEASISVQLNCSIGPVIVPQKLRLVPVKPGGTFKESLEGSDVDEDGTSVRIYETFSGRFNGDRTSALTKSRVYMTIHATDGTVVKCDSGVVRLRAH